MRTRKRASTTELAKGSYGQTLFGVTTTTPYKVAVGEDQTFLDDIHPWWNYHRKEGARKGPLVGKFNIGGPMSSTRRRLGLVFLPQVVESSSLSGGTFKLTGPRVPEHFYQSTGTSQYGTVPLPPTDAELNGWGTSGVNRTIPTSPAWNAAQFIGELHEGLPKIPLKGLIKERSTNSIGGEYLNYQFGIRPFISDYKKYNYAFNKSDEIERHLIAGSGKLIQRSVSLLNEETVTQSSSTVNLYPLIPWVAASRNQVLETITTRVSREVWFSGTYSYLYKPSSNPIKNQLDRLRHVYGIDPSISTSWELMPYSWLVDWHTNIGTVLENMSLFAKDGLVMRWGYVMCRQKVIKTFSFPPYGYINLVSETLARRPGNPFGFASNPIDYNSRQWAILSALGISKGPHIRF